MPAIIPFIPLIVGGVAAGTTIAAAHTQAGAAQDAANTNANAATTAAQAQAQANRDSLNFQTQVYNQRQAALAPYRSIGGGALSQLGSLYGVNVPSMPNLTSISLPSTPGQPMTQPRTGSTPQQRVTAPSMTAPANLAGLGQTNQNDPIVTVQAPTGETRQMPLSQAQPYLQRGATRIS